MKYLIADMFEFDEGLPKRQVTPRQARIGPPARHG